LSGHAGFVVSGTKKAGSPNQGKTGQKDYAMGIIPSWRVSDPRNPPQILTDHDPLVCGIDYASSCPSCQAGWVQDMDSREEQRRRKWDSIRRRHWPILRAQSYEPPGDPSNEVLVNLVEVLFSQAHRNLLREIFLDLTSNDIADIASAINQGRTK
jgi:hypothetical protein